VVACGSPLEVIQDGKQSYTARFLRDYLNGGGAKSPPSRHKTAVEEATA
jgi:hypothetical protein